MTIPDKSPETPPASPPIVPGASKNPAEVSTPGRNRLVTAPSTPQSSAPGGRHTPSRPAGQLGSDLLTPIISNSNVEYVDHERAASAKAMPGFVVVSPGMADAKESGSELRGLRQRRLPRLPPAKRSAEAAGAMLLGEGLVMPGGSDESVESLEAHRSAVLANSRPSQEQGSKQGTEQGLAPIELKPNRKFFSFSGAAQYKKSLGGDEQPRTKFSRSNSGHPQLETINSPRRPSPPDETPQRPYQPTARGAHGVREMADTKDLDAIFKSPRSAAALPRAVSPAHFAEHSTRTDKEEREAGDVLRQPVEIDDRQWSIPSIRLANHVNLDSSLHSFENICSEDEYTDESVSCDDTGSYIAEADGNDDASLGSYDPVQRRRESWRLFRAAPQLIPDSPPKVSPEAAHPAIQPAPQLATQPTIQPAPSTSSLEQNLRRISINNNFVDIPKATSLLSDYDEADDVVDENYTPSFRAPPVITIAAPFSMDDADGVMNCYDGDLGDRLVRRSSSRRRRARRKKPSGSAAAFEWLKDLQNRPSNQLLIAEAASSKFLNANKSTEGNSQPSSEDAAKALGMAHPLCRSQTVGNQLAHPSSNFTTQNAPVEASGANN